MTQLPLFRLEAYFSRWEFSARHHLSASDAQSMTIRELLALEGEGAGASFEDLHLGYTQTFGDPALRGAIAATYDTMDAQDILCFAGAEEGLYIACHALLDAGDHAIVVTPNYQAAESVPLSICRVSGVALDSERNWSLDIDRVAAVIRPETRLISINFPHNPTGKIIERDVLDALITLCRKHGIWLFSDEVYRLLGPRPELQVPQVADLYERGLSLNVMSKAYGLPGLRIGWIACRDRDVLLRMERMKHFLSICNAAPGEYLARVALRHRDTILGCNNFLLRNNLELLDSFFADYPGLFEWARPDGGCIAYPRYTGSGTVDDFTTALVEQSGVLLLPSGIFSSELGPTPADRFRIGFGRADLAQGLEAFRDHLEGRARG